MILNCLNCKAFVDAIEVADYKNEITDDYELSRTFKEYKFLKCPICSNPFLTHSLFNDDIMSSYKSSVLYPTPNKTITSEVATYIKIAFEEAQLCFENRAFTACVIMCRKTVEGICKEYNIENENLYKKLKLMKEQGIIDQNLYDWADTLRLAGNDAAHDLNVTFAFEDAQDIIDFTYAIIEYVFTYRKKFELFKQRKINPDKN